MFITCHYRSVARNFKCSVFLELCICVMDTTISCGVILLLLLALFFFFYSYIVGRSKMWKVISFIDEEQLFEAATID